MTRHALATVAYTKYLHLAVRMTASRRDDGLWPSIAVIYFVAPYDIVAETAGLDVVPLGYGKGVSGL
jgi:hypothetical protein